MHRLSLALLLLIAPSPLGQEPEPAPQVATATIDAVVERLYRSVSFDQGGEPDWPLLRSLLLPGARFVQPPRPGETAKAIDADAFVQLFRDDMKRVPMRERGFHETVLGVRKFEFGRIAHAIVVFEAKHGGPDARGGRGVDSIEFVSTPDGWRIVSITTEVERPDRPIPKELLEQPR